ncbi:hypothetical protein [Prauserella rugosa]|uniref:PE family protein n=1 Tax=Prauserella rugosa TaxID=43354 RepID=A0A660C5V1_9PSEU|nr:hypothetical protein [Prauserella rugosa]KID28028.1 hypothetical protein HQ32_04689 [Prauserella sp. Am3]KMS83318.1 hypothetical protein ACZ91_53805 [Streptomyces regensis]TWH18970.1 hypothetical protein JD82_00792 [Prauserella rugosa]
MTGGTPAPVTGPVDIPAGAFTVSPELAEDSLRKITDLQDEVARMVREAKVLARSVPLGGGYAAELGEFMARYGLDPAGDSGGDPAAGVEPVSDAAAGNGAASARAAVPALVAFGRQLADLRGQIEAALERYRAQDEQAAGDMGGVDCEGG